jgi:hypothetical protein
MRWFDEQGNLIPTNEERLPEEQRRAQAAEAARDQERTRAEALAAKLRALGVDPDEV